MPDDDAPRLHLTLTPQQLNLVLMALGQLPYVQVHALIEQLESEAGPQLVALAGDASATAAGS